MKRIFWIDLSSEGDSSFYSNAWNGVLGYRADYFVHANNSFAHKFFKYESFSKKNKFNKILYFIYISFFLFLNVCSLKNNKYKVVINIYQPFIFYLFYIKLLKFKKIDFYVIIHDVESFALNLYPPLVLTSIEKILKFSNKVILHNGVSKIKELYDFDKEIIQIPFPVRKPFDINLTLQKKIKLPEEYILFIGKYREEKGLENLLSLTKKDFTTFHLVIASDIPVDLEKRFLSKFGDSVVILNRYISDLEFSFLINNATYGICPYTMGTNSGIYSTLISNKVPTIISNISAFDNFFQIEELKIFDYNRAGEIISNLPTLHSNEYNEMVNRITDFLNKQMIEFNQEINKIL